MERQKRMTDAISNSRCFHFLDPRPSVHVGRLSERLNDWEQTRRRLRASAHLLSLLEDRYPQPNGLVISLFSEKEKDWLRRTVNIQTRKGKRRGKHAPKGAMLHVRRTERENASSTMTMETGLRASCLDVSFSLLAHSLIFASFVYGMYVDFPCSGNMNCVLYFGNGGLIIANKKKATMNELFFKNSFRFFFSFCYATGSLLLTARSVLVLYIIQSVLA